VKIRALRSEHVEFIPRDLDEGVLYISAQFQTASHLCCCGCGTKVVTPLRPTEFSLTEFDGGATLSPSIGNWNYPCQSHYWIKGGRVIVAGRMSREEINQGRQYDDALKSAYFKKPIPWWLRLIRFFVRLFTKLD
jgi:hypothetical protein